MKKILIFDRINAKQFPGGDTVQIYAIKDFLIAQGHEVELSTNPLEDLSRFDYIFIFNLTNPLEAYMYSHAALRYNKPYILFPVYWNLDSLKMIDCVTLKSVLKNSLPDSIKSYIRGQKFLKMNGELVGKLGLVRKDFYNHFEVVTAILKNAYAICPNSYAEWNHLEEQFNVSYLSDRVKIIYNGINLATIDNIEEQSSIKQKYHLPNEYICCIGGIGPRKNQLSLIRAANQVQVNVVIIGQVANGYEKYGQTVKELAGDNVYFLGHLSQEETFKILKSSIGHIQPSFIETPGLASLEAAALGIPIAVANTAPVKEYFQEHAIYCDPANSQSIADCLVQLTQIENYDTSWVQRYAWSSALENLRTVLGD